MDEFRVFITAVSLAVGTAVLPMLLMVLPHNWGWDEQKWAGTPSQVIGTTSIAIGQAVWFYTLYLANIISGTLALALVCGLVLADALIGGWCILLKHSHPEVRYPNIGRGGNNANNNNDPRAVGGTATHDL